MIIIAGTIGVNVIDWDEAKREMQQMMAQTWQEPGCISYRFYTDPTDDKRAFVFEEWESVEALQAHFQTPHMAAFNRYLAKVATGESSIKRYEVASSTPL